MNTPVILITAVISIAVVAIGLGTVVGAFTTAQSAGATGFQETLSCTVTAGTCNVTLARDATTLDSVNQTVPITADKTGDSTLGGDNRTITITSIASS